MTSTQLSDRKKSAVLNMFLFTLNKNKAVIILGSVLSFLVLPIFPTFSMRENIGSNGYISEITLAALFACFLISMAVTLILTDLNFSFMHTKSSSDLFFAVPLTRRGLFVSRLLASVVGGFVPIIIPTVSAFLICLGDGRNSYAYGSLWFLALTLLTGIMFAVVCSFFMLFAGRNFEAMVSFVVFNVGLPVLALIVVEQMTNNLYGLPYTAFENEFYLAFSPISSGGYLAFSFMNSIMNEESFKIPVSTIIWVSLTVVIFIISLIFAKKRKSESAGSAFAHKLMPTLLIGLASILAGFLFGFIFTGDAEFSFAFVTFAIIGGLLIATVLGAIFNRNFKNVGRSLLIGGVSAALYSAFVIIIATGGFGYVTRTPDIEKVESATYLVGGSWYNANTDVASTTITDKKDIEKLLTVNKNVIENRVLNANDDTNTFYVAYKLKNGKTFERWYSVCRYFDKNNFALLDGIENKMNNLDFAFGSEENVRMYVSAPDMGEGKETEYLITREQAKALVTSAAKEHKTTADYTETRVYLYNMVIDDEGEEMFKRSKRHSGTYYETVIVLTEKSTKTLELLEETKKSAIEETVYE